MTKIFMAPIGAIREKDRVGVIKTELTPKEVIEAINEFEAKKGRGSDDK